MNVSERSVYMASKVLKQGHPELGRLIDAGQLSISVAAWVAGLPPDDQAWLVEQGPGWMRACAADARAERTQQRRPQICSHCGAELET
jgi:hypothetical protein